MKNVIHIIENAEQSLLSDYAIYVDAKIDIEEIPLRFNEWIECNEIFQD